MDASTSAFLSVMYDGTSPLQAIMRHVANPHPTVRAHLLLLIGKFRRRRLQHLRDSLLAAPPLNPPNPCFSIEDETSTLVKKTETALKAALTVSFAYGGHDSRVMTDACMELVLLHFPLQFWRESSVDKEGIYKEATKDYNTMVRKYKTFTDGKFLL